MEILIRKINIKRIYEKLNEWKEIEFKSYPSFKELIENFINDDTIGVISTFNILLMLNSFDKMVKDKNKYINLPINSVIYMVNPYTNKEIFNSEFLYKVNNEEIEIYLKIEPVDEKDVVPIFTVLPLINEFKKFSDTLKEEDVQNTIIDNIKLKMSNGFESILQVVRLNNEEKEKLEIKENLDLYYKQMAYAIDPYKSTILYNSAIKKRGV